MEAQYAVKGTFLYTKTSQEFTVDKGYLLVQDGRCVAFYEKLPDDLSEVPIRDYESKLIIPGLCDLHLHAPQYPICGNGMNLGLLDWLKTYTFPEEAKYADLTYAKEVYRMFVKELRQSYTTRACIFGTIHQEANTFLMDCLEECGLFSYVGKVNMDRNSPESLMERSARSSYEETKEWIERTLEHYKRVKPILTPRFIPVCSDELMLLLGELKRRYKIPYQSHLAETLAEIAWVHELEVNTKNYTQAYAELGAFGEESKTIMAHCIHLSKEEEEFLLDHEVYIAHCPDSNTNLSSGVAPAKRFLTEGQRVGLGSDIGGGASLDMFYVLRAAIQSSKIYARLLGGKEAALSLEEAFYMATKSGGAFFGQVGSFEKGYEFDALVLEDHQYQVGIAYSPIQRLEKLIYLGNYSNIVAKYCYGQEIELE